MPLNREATNASAVAARENARETDGQFGAQEHSAPELALRGPYEPGQPVHIAVTYEEYRSEHDEHPEQVHTQKVDLVNVLDTWPLEAVQHLQSDPWADASSVIYDLQETGELTHPSHPFSVDFTGSDLGAYIEYRETNDLDEPISEKASPVMENLVAAVSAQQAEIKNLHALLAEAEALKEAGEERIIRAIALAAHPTAATITVQLDHHRYPVEIYDENQQWVNIGEEREQALVAEIRKHLGDDPGVVGGRGTARVIDLHPTEG